MKMLKKKKMKILSQCNAIIRQYIQKWTFKTFFFNLFFQNGCPYPPTPLRLLRSKFFQCDYSGLKNYFLNHCSMITPVTPKLQNYHCEDCDSTFTRKYNLTRHMERIHASTKNKPTSTKDIPTSTKDIPTSTKLSLPQQCNICEKIFAKHCTMIKHKDKCKGKINPLQCIYCNEVFTCPPNKYRHMKICKERISTGLIIPEGQGNTIIGTNNNIQTQNNIENLIQNNNTSNIQNNNNTSNIQNNNNTIIINNFGNESYAHISDEFKEKCIRSLTNSGVIKLIENVHFNKDVPENHNIKIHSLKSQQLSVYNNNEWNIKDKNNVLDDMIMNATASLCRHYHGSAELKEIDIKELHYEIFTNLQSIYGRVKERYYPIRREVFASLINLCSKVSEEEYLH